MRGNNSVIAAVELGPVHANNGLALPPTKGEGKEWDAANTLRIRKEHDAALALCGWQPVNLFLKVRGTPLSGRLAASRVACLERPSGATHSLPADRKGVFASPLLA